MHAVKSALIVSVIFAHFLNGMEKSELSPFSPLSNNSGDNLLNDPDPTQAPPTPLINIHDFTISQAVTAASVDIVPQAPAAKKRSRDSSSLRVSSEFLDTLTFLQDRAVDFLLENNDPNMVVLSLRAIEAHFRNSPSVVPRLTQLRAAAQTATYEAKIEFDLVTMKSLQDELRKQSIPAAGASDSKNKESSDLHKLRGQKRAKLYHACLNRECVQQLAARLHALNNEDEEDK